MINDNSNNYDNKDNFSCPDMGKIILYDLPNTAFNMLTSLLHSEILIIFKEKQHFCLRYLEL